MTDISVVKNIFVGGWSFGPPDGTDSKIRSFAKLPVGWHYGRGGPPSESIIQIAREYLSLLLLHGFEKTEAFPGAGGEILLAGYKGEHSLEIIVEVDKKFSVTHEFEGQNRYRESELSGLQASEAIRSITATIELEECNTSCWYIQGISVTRRGASATWPSDHQATELGHQSYWKTVAFKRQGTFVLTSTSSTPASAANLLYSGGLIHPPLVPRVTLNNQTPIPATSVTTKSKVLPGKL